MTGFIATHLRAILVVQLLGNNPAITHLWYQQSAGFGPNIHLFEALFSAFICRTLRLSVILVTIQIYRFLCEELVLFGKKFLKTCVENSGSSRHKIIQQYYFLSTLHLKVTIFFLLNLLAEFTHFVLLLYVYMLC